MKRNASDPEPGPERSCRFCRTKRPKSLLTRWVSGTHGWVRDTHQRLPGRGLYTCSPACEAKLQKVEKNFGKRKSRLS